MIPVHRLPLLAAVLLAGCGQNAVLELTVDLPPRDGVDRAYALVQVRRAADAPIDGDWASSARDLEAVELSASSRVRDHISVVADEHLDDDLALKVRFCHAPDCGDAADDPPPVARWIVEHPFYEGRRTRATVAIPEIPPPSTPSTGRVERCEVEGCLSGDPSSWCVDDQHACVRD